MIPFPVAINLGTDIVHLPRIASLLARRGNNLSRFTRRILCDQEQRDFHRRFKDSIALQPQSKPSNSIYTPPVTADMTRWLAGRFAAKEAARKAAPCGAASIGWKDVMVRVQKESDINSGAERDPDTVKAAMAEGVSRRPEIVYLGTKEDGSDSRIGRLSISHDGDYVTATVLAAG